MGVMLSDEAGCLPEQLFLKVGQWLELAACLYSGGFRLTGFSEARMRMPAYLCSTGPYQGADG